VIRKSLAHETAKKLLSDAGISSPPIKIQLLLHYLKKNSKMHIMERDFAKDVSGVTLTDEFGESFIGYRGEDHVHRQRFTVAHELGHVILGHTHPRSYGEVKKSDSCLEANEFAAELLMPLGFLKADINAGISDPRKLSGRYGVSEEAMWIKLKNSGLIGKLVQ